MVNTAKILALDVAATSGPWSWDEDVGWWCRSRLIRPVPIAEVLSPEYNGESELTIRVSPEDAALIEHYRTACPEAARELDQLRARIATLTAPVEGVDLEEVLRLDREGTPGPWVVEMDGDGDEFTTWEWPWRIKGVVNFAEEGDNRNDPTLIAYYRTAAPALARALMAERATAAKQHARLRRALLDLDRPDLGSAAMRAQVHNLANFCMCVAQGMAVSAPEILCKPGRVVERLRAQEAHIRRLEAQEQRLMAEAEDLRLTLAAEQGRAEGAPSPDWTPIRAADGSLTAWHNKQTGAVVEAYIDRLSATDVRFAQWRWRTRSGRKGRADNARAAMLAANAAVKP